LPTLILAQTHADNGQSLLIRLANHPLSKERTSFCSIYIFAAFQVSSEEKSLYKKSKSFGKCRLPGPPIKVWSQPVST